MKKIGKLASSNLRKVTAIFRELDEKRTRKTSALEAIAQAFTDDEYSAEVAREIAFHLTDWRFEARFLVALLLFPERFSPDEIKLGVAHFVIDAPNHVAAAAKLVGWPVKDIFGVGALDGKDDA